MTKEYLERIKWKPGLDIDDLTLEGVLKTLPGDEPAKIPWLVRLLENPKSKLALPGAISLERHDTHHILFGRGITITDEAFVIGVTMGSAEGLKPWHLKVYYLATRYINPHPFRFGPHQWAVFESGLKIAKKLGLKNLHLIPLENRLNEKIGLLRKELGIDKELLKETYAKEGLLGSKLEVSQRPTLKRLINFEQVSWPHSEQAKKSELEKRLKAYPQGIFILSDHGEDVAQITVSPKDLPSLEKITSFEMGRDLPIVRGSKDLWITNISRKQGPLYAGRGYVTYLLTQVISWAKKEGYESLAAGITCSGLKEKIEKGEVEDVQEYIEKEKNPALRCIKTAAKNKKSIVEVGPVIKDYWLDDKDSLAYGVMVRVRI